MERDQDLVHRLQTGIWGWWLCLPLLLFVSILLYVGGKGRGQPVATPIILAHQSKDLILKCSGTSPSTIRAEGLQ